MAQSYSSVQVSDTTKAEESTAAGNIKIYVVMNISLFKGIFIFKAGSHTNGLYKRVQELYQQPLSY